MEILFGIFLLLVIVILFILTGVLALFIYEEIPDDLKEAYWNWKNKKK